MSEQRVAEFVNEEHVMRKVMEFFEVVSAALGLNSLISPFGAATNPVISISKLSGIFRQLALDYDDDDTDVKIDYLFLLMELMGQEAINTGISLYTVLDKYSELYILRYKKNTDDDEIEDLIDRSLEEIKIGMKDYYESHAKDMWYFKQETRI